MEVNVFKLYDENGVRQFDAINPSYAKWLFDSVNKRDYEHADGYQPNPFVNKNKPGEQPEDTIYFDGGGSINYDLGSSVKNVVLKYNEPTVNGDETNYVVFKESSGFPIKLTFLVRDPVGLDSEVIRIGLSAGTDANVGLNNGAEPSNVYKVVRVNDSEIDAETYDADWVNNWSISKGQNSSTQYRVNVSLDLYALAEELGVDVPDGEFAGLNDLWIELFDLAGNKLRITGLKKFICIPYTFEEFLSKLKKLSLDFVDTYPPNMFIENNMIGSTYVVIENPNNDFCQKYGLFIKANLKNDSLGYLNPYEIVRDEQITMKQKVDGIDSTGYVKAEGFLWGTDSWSLEQLNAIKAKVMAEGILGKFITECADNKRKLFIDPFVPECIKSEMMFNFLKFVENYFNTMFTPMEKDCRIGLLEKIQRISDFKNIDACEFPLTGNFGEEHGSELDFDLNGVERITQIAGKYTNCTFEQEELVRKFYRTLPFINKFKGTIYCFNTLFNCLGIHTELIPLWERRAANGYGNSKPEFIEESQADNTCFLSSHICLMCNGYFAKDLIEISDVILRMAESILPIVRVIESLMILEVSKSSNTLILSARHGETLKREETDEAISFIYKRGDANITYSNSDYVKVKVPLFCTKSKVQVKEIEYTDNPIAEAATKSRGMYPQGNAYNYFNAYRNTIKKYTKPFIITMANTYDATELAVPGTKFFNLSLNPTEIEFTANSVNIICTKDNFDKLVNLDKYDYSIISFKFNRITNEFCYPIKYSDFTKM